MYEAPAGAERLFVKLNRAEGFDRAVEELAQRPERFGQLKLEEHRTLGIVTKRTDDKARAAASRAALEGARYGERWRALEKEKERAPRALREAKRAHERATAATRGRPSERVAAGRVEGLGKALSPVDKRALGKAAPEVGRAVEKAVEKALKRGLDRGLGIGF